MRLSRKAAIVIALGLIAGCNRAPLVHQPHEELARRYSEAYCKALDVCGCATEQYYADFDSCQSDLEQRFLEDVMQSDVGDLDCMEYWEQTLSDDPCLASGTPGVTCSLARSDRSEGATCQVGYLPGSPIEQCEFGLECQLGTCQGGPIVRKPEGAACETSFWGSCGIGMNCGADGVCHEQGREGDSCQLGGCELGLHCGGPSHFTGTCEPNIPLGGDCDPGDFNSCVDEANGEAHCNPESRICELGAGARICASVALPSNFQ